MTQNHPTSDANPSTDTTSEKLEKSQDQLLETSAQADEQENETQGEGNSTQTTQAGDTHESEKNLGLAEKMAQLKQDLLQRLDDLKGLKGADLSEMSAFIKAEFNAVIEDLSKLGKELKQDVSEISHKHKEHLTETLKRSKEHTLEALGKSAKTDSKDESSASE